MVETMPHRAVDQVLVNVPVDRLHPDPDNPRSDLGDLTELAASIEEIGILQPIVARRDAQRLVVVAGHRRLAAAKLAGLEVVPVIVRPPMRTDDVLVAMLIENGQRRDLDPIEEARAFARLMRLENLRTHGALAKRVGRGQGYVSARLALLALTPAEQAEVSTGQLKLIEATEKARMSSGRVRSKRDPARLWYGASHELAPRAKARCLRLGHKRGTCLPGGIACSECWESILRADERTGLAEYAVGGRCPTCGHEDRCGDASPDPTRPDPSRAEPSRAEPDDDGPDDVDQVAVRRAADGEPITLTRAERHAAVELLHHRGLSDRQIADRLRITDRTVLRLRQRIGLAAVTA